MSVLGTEGEKTMLGVKLALWASMKGMHEGLGVDASMSKSK